MSSVKIAMISSTLRDLPEHRAKVRDSCLGQSVLPKMMEHWPALDEDGIIASLRMVDNSDIYVGVFAHRYGYVPSGHDRSITEMEYDRAVERGIPRLVFIIHDEHDLKIDQIEIETFTRLLKLKDRLKGERTVAFFKSADDLSAALTKSLAALGLTPPAATTDSTSLAKAVDPVFDPRNYVFFVPYRSKGDQVVGRDSALDGIRTQLGEGRRTAIGQTASFRGLGGLGKTQLAVEYAYRFRDHYPNGVVWLNADQDIEGQLIKVAELGRWVAPETEPKDKLAIARQRIQTSSHVLLIFDNLDDPASIKHYVPQPEAEPHILVTSRVDHPDFVPVALDLLDAEHSVQLLAQEAGHSPASSADVEAARDISMKLGGLPLALELAGAYMRHRGIGWSAYRDLLSHNLKAALPDKFLRGSFTQHEADLYGTLRLGDDILSEEPLLREILDVLTWSGSSAMGEPLLCALLNVKDPSQVTAALAFGVELRLLRKTPGAERYALHRLVCEVRREDVPLDQRTDWVVTTAERLADWFQPLKRDYSNLHAFEAEVDHLHAWQQHADQFAPALASRLIWLQAYPPFHHEHYQGALDCLEQARVRLVSSGLSDPELKGNLLTDLCTITSQLGGYEEARRLGEEALAIRSSLYGEDNSETAMSLHNLGSVIRILGDPAEALPYHEKSLRVWQKIYGEDHIDTALALDALSSCYVKLGNKKEGRKFAEEALAIRRKVLGSKHPDTVVSLNSVSSIHMSGGDTDSALLLTNEALDIATDLFGIRSLLRAVTLKNLASIHRQRRDYRLALESASEALQIRRDLVGDKHTETLVAVVELAAAYCESSRVRDGFQLLDKYRAMIPKSHSHHAWFKQRVDSFHQRYFIPGFRQPRKKRK